MSMIDSIVLLWRSPSLFNWDRFIFEIFLLVHHTVVKCWSLSRHLQIVFWHWVKYSSFYLKSMA